MTRIPNNWCLLPIPWVQVMWNVNDLGSQKCAGKLKTFRPLPYATTEDLQVIEQLPYLLWCHRSLDLFQVENASILTAILIQGSMKPCNNQWKTSEGKLWPFSSMGGFCYFAATFTAPPSFYATTHYLCSKYVPVVGGDGTPPIP